MQFCDKQTGTLVSLELFTTILQKYLFYSTVPKNMSVLIFINLSQIKKALTTANIWVCSFKQVRQAITPSRFINVVFPQLELEKECSGGRFVRKRNLFLIFSFWYGKLLSAVQWKCMPKQNFIDLFCCMLFTHVQYIPAVYKNPITYIPYTMESVKVPIESLLLLKFKGIFSSFKVSKLTSIHLSNSNYVRIYPSEIFMKNQNIKN